MDAPVFDAGDLAQVNALEVPEGTACMICFDDVTRANAVAYKTAADSAWHLATFCVECVRHLLKIQYDKYITALSTTTCAKEQRALLERGPPVNVSDRLGFPEAGQAEVHALFDFGAAAPLSAKLEGSLVGAADSQTGTARQALWDELQKFRFRDDLED